MTWVDDDVYIFNKEIKLEVSSGSSPGSFSVPGFEVLFPLPALIFVFLIAGRRRNLIEGVQSVAPVFRGGVPDDIKGVKQELASAPGPDSFLNDDFSVILV